jgi:hypothetical protein
MLYDVLKAGADVGATEGTESLSPLCYTQIPLAASVGVAGAFHACRQGISSTCFHEYFANAGELESASCE